MKTVSGNHDDGVPADQGKDADVNVVNIDDLESEERSVEKTPAPSIAKRLRSQTGKAVASVSTDVKITKTTRKTVGVGPKKTWSKVVPPTETKKKSLKRNEPPSSDSDFEVETDVPTTGGTSRKTTGGKKIPLRVPSAPMDNISFHHETRASRWKFVYNRRLSLENELGKKALECQELVDMITDAGLI
ncbi:envelope-like protein, partial [Trifolium medium]|nr:envelope-like protein [Trifolium medium]